MTTKRIESPDIWRIRESILNARASSKKIPRVDPGPIQTRCIVGFEDRAHESKPNIRGPRSISSVTSTRSPNHSSRRDTRKLAEQTGIKHVPLTVGESSDGPPDYEIAREADVTVLMWRRHQVKVNVTVRLNHPWREW
jgi:hypothetical protein